MLPFLTFLVINAHFEHSIPDLRIKEPFEELQNYIDSFRLDDLTALKLPGQLPYPIILGQLWKEFNELERFESFSDFAKREAEERFGHSGDDLNLALARYCRNCREDAVDWINSFARDDSHEDWNTENWNLVSAIREFVQKHRVLPLNGNLPDMDADSTTYLKMVELYKNKAKEDVQKVVDCLSKDIPCSMEQVQYACKHLDQMKVISTAIKDCSSESPLVTILQWSSSSEGMNEWKKAEDSADNYNWEERAESIATQFSIPRQYHDQITEV